MNDRTDFQVVHEYEKQKAGATVVIASSLFGAIFAALLPTTAVYGVAGWIIGFVVGTALLFLPLPKPTK